MNLEIYGNMADTIVGNAFLLIVLCSSSGTINTHVPIYMYLSLASTLVPRPTSQLKVHKGGGLDKRQCFSQIRAEMQACIHCMFSDVNIYEYPNGKGRSLFFSILE